MLDALLRNLRLRIKRARHPARSRSELHDFWRSPDRRNQPTEYLAAEASQRSRFLVDLVARHCHREDPVLEIGCNADRNLDFLFRAGHRDLHAIEINAQALELLRRTFPDWRDRVEIHERPMEEVLPELGSGRYGLVFTMAVLEHVHPDSEWVFAEIARVTKGVLITVEDEVKVSWRHFPRRYDRIFEPLGLKQVEAIPCNDRDHGLSPVHVARVFTRQG